MNIDVTTGALDGLLASIRKRVTETWNEAGSIAREAAEFGASTAQSYTRSRPGATTGKAGRIDSGTMVEAIRWEPVAFSLDLAEARYGFTNSAEDYFALQTVTGFRHARSAESKYIAPTFALRDSRKPVEEFARDQLRRRL